MEDILIAIGTWSLAFLYPTICAWKATKAERKYKKGMEGWE